MEYDNKDWDDYPVTEHCGSCLYFQNDSCDNPCGYRYEDKVYYHNDACGAWEDGR